jgi:hypothetical protein
MPGCGTALLSEFAATSSSVKPISTCLRNEVRSVTVLFPADESKATEAITATANPQYFIDVARIAEILPFG